MLSSAKKTSKGGHLSCSLEKFQQPDKTWQLWYTKNPREKDSSQWSPCWLTRGSEHCTFPWAPTLLYDSSPRFLTTQSRETANNYFAVRCQFICNSSSWNSSCPHFFFFFSTRKAGCARKQCAWNHWISKHFQSPLQQQTQCLIFLSLPPLAIFPLVSMEAGGELQSLHLKQHWPKLSEWENRDELEWEARLARLG